MMICTIIMITLQLAKRKEKNKRGSQEEKKQQSILKAQNFIASTNAVATNDYVNPLFRKVFSSLTSS